MPISTAGMAYAVGAYLAWGLVPIYWHALGAVPALEVVAHRIAWSLLFLAALLTVSRRWSNVGAALRSGRTVRLLVATTALVTANWGIFIGSVQSGRLLEASLGYYINPLVNVLLGVAFLGERLRRGQAVAVAMAALGVLTLAIGVGVFPWVSLLLAATFGAYGLLRKIAAVDALAGLFIETALASPIAVSYLVFQAHAGRGSFGHEPPTRDLLLACCGAITAVPLLWFTAAARRLPLGTLGFFQYIAPTCQFLLAVGLLHEPMTRGHVAAFALIWTGVALFSRDLAKRAPNAR